MYQKEITKDTLLVTWEGWLYLRTKMHEERSTSDKPISDKYVAKARRSFDRSARDGWGAVDDGSFGGCIGNPVNAWEERRWTSWSIADMKKILDGAKLPYKDGKPVKAIEIYL